MLASNLRSNLDQAFTCFFQSSIHFPISKHIERYRLWKKAFSEKTQLEDKIDLVAISSNYELSGGHIMNVVRYNTLMALKMRSHLITYDDFIIAIRREFQIEGKTLSTQCIPIPLITKAVPFLPIDPRPVKVSL